MKFSYTYPFQLSHRYISLSIYQPLSRVIHAKVLYQWLLCAFLLELTQDVTFFSHGVFYPRSVK